MSADDRPLTVLIAPDSFKGSLTSVEVARALAAGWSRARPHDEIVLSPLADGGEGTLAAVEAAGGWAWRTSAVHDPLGRPVDARWLWREVAGTGMAYVEMAQASGLSLVAPGERDPIGGDQRRDRRAAGGRRDRGRPAHHPRHRRQRDDGRRARPDRRARRHRATVELDVACDVSNPLLGPNGAAAVYGPQKGATPMQVIELDARNAAWADELERTTGRHERDTPGAGAAGGVGFGLLAIQDRFKAFALRPGVDLVMETTDFDAKLVRADLVITGEGRIDAQTAFGKTALGVAKRAQAAGVRCIAVGGGVEPEGIDALAAVGATAVPVSDPPIPVEASIAAGAAPVERCGERLARLIAAGAPA